MEEGRGEMEGGLGGRGREKREGRGGKGRGKEDEGGGGAPAVSGLDRSLGQEDTFM